MRKVISISPEKWAIAEELMKATYTDSLSQLLSALMLAYKQNKPRAVGRPRKDTGEDETEDDPRLYKAADWPDNRNGYTYDELKEWYAYDPRRGAIPQREELELHPDSPQQ